MRLCEISFAGHAPARDEVSHALTFRLDRLMGAGQSVRTNIKLPSFIAPPRCCSCSGSPSRQLKIVQCGFTRQPGTVRFKMFTTFTLPVCSECATRIRLVKFFLLLTFAVLISIGILFSRPDAPQDALIGMAAAGLIMSVILISLNFFDPAKWSQGRFLFANREYLQLFREANPAIPAEAVPRYEDGIFVVVTSVFVISFAVLGMIAAMSLQEQLAPSDAFLFGRTPVGFNMLFGGMVLLILGPVFALALYVADRIHHSFKIPPADPLPAHVWAQAWTASGNWRVVGAIAAAFLLAVVGKGFGSYFYLTERELAVRAPLETSLRHYQWDDVAAVFAGCRIIGKGPRLTYVLRMSDGHDIDFARVPPLRLAPVFERMASRLDSLSGVRYEFDISEDALSEFGRKHRGGLENAIRNQVRRHGGIIQR